MTHQHIVDSRRCLVPDGKGQHTAKGVKGCSGHLTVLNDQVLSGEEFGEVALDFLVDHAFRLSTEISIGDDPTSGPPPVTVIELAQGASHLNNKCSGVPWWCNITNSMSMRSICKWKTTRSIVGVCLSTTLLRTVNVI